ncbi:MAG: hypothetical protein IJR61_06835, partial [Clostridia bacterium]|nr:hypothetical protein [Clostridia bacterium]
MKKTRSLFGKIIKFGILGVYIALITFLVVQGLTPGNESAKISNRVGDKIDTLLSDIRKPAVSAVAAESVTSAEISVNGERITSGEITMLPGDDGIFSCSVLPENASNKSIIYTSSNAGVKVNAYGEFQAVSPCLAVIKAASQENENLYATISVTVKDIYADGMEIANTPSSSLFVGQKTTISIKYIPENATSGRELEWESDDE